MLVGVCWPSPGSEVQPLFDGSVLDTLRESTGATHLRLNFDHRRGVAEAVRHIEHIKDRGWEVLSILDFDYDNPSPGGYAAFCDEFIKETRLGTIELGNEPYMLHRMKPERYAHMYRVGAQSIRDTGVDTQLLVACEPTKSGKRIDYFEKVRREIPVELIDGLAIHPYRNPLPPSHAPFGTREKEADYFRAQSPGKSLHVTEVGWDLRDGVTEAKQADYTFEELKVWERLGAESAYLYAFMDGGRDYRFGILDEYRTPRPVAAAIKRFRAGER